MVVVIAVILVLAALVAPAVRAVWSQRNISTAENTIRGVLMTTRPRAMQTGLGGEAGLFFMVDADGVQRIYTMERDPLAQNVFNILAERDFALPAPMRVVPRYAVDADTTNPADDHVTFNAAELANNVFPGTTGPGLNEAQRHRNFFTMVFNHQGQLRVWREVLIRDGDADGNGRGDRTGLGVGDWEGHPEVTKYNPLTGAAADIVDANGSRKTELNLVTDAAGAAINLPSVDGLLVYDDALFLEFSEPGDRRDYLLRAGAPFYVSRLSGAVVKGPAGENQ